MASRFQMKLLAAVFTLLILPRAGGSEPATNQQTASALQRIPPTLPHWLAVDQLATGDTLTGSIKSAGVQSATLRIAAEFCRARILLNGRPLADIAPYCQLQSFDVTDAVRLGENRIEIQPQPVADAPAAVALTLTILQTDGQTLTLATDQNWRVSARTGKAASPASYGMVPEELWGTGRHDISIDQFENYEQWQQAKGGSGTSPRFFVAPGFEITQLRIAQPDEGSWVSLATDEQGRLTIAREDQGFLRMTLAQDFRSVAKVQAIESELLECRGLLYRDGWLYASANNSKKLCRLKLTEDGKPQDLTNLRELSGGVGHGRNDLSLSSDSVYLICGDSVDPLTTDFVDHTSPLRQRVAGRLRGEGSLLRTSLDGQHWELFCAGLRNPYGVANHPQNGDPFTYDADNEYDLGMPWYRPTRVLQLLPDADFGYRNASGQIPPRFSDQADNAPPLIDIGRGSPTAAIFGSEFRFPHPWNNALFVLDWTYGRVLAIHLAPRGAGYRASAELFLQGKPLNVTDVAAGKDGAMYLITGGRKTQSALYRISPVTPPSTTEGGAPPSSMQFQERVQQHSTRNRELARRFQSAVQRPSAGERPSREQHDQAGDVTGTLPFLDDPDPVVRYAARTALEKKPSNEWCDVMLTADRTSVRGLMAVARVLDPVRVPAIIRQLKKLDLEVAPIDQRMVWLRTLELCLTSDRDAVFAQKDAIEQQILAGWQSCQSPHWQISVEGSNADYRRRASLLLAEFESPELSELVVRDLLSGENQDDQITGLMALRNRRTGWTTEARKLQLQTLAAMPQMVGGEGLPAFHAWIERETMQTLSPDEQTLYTNLKASNQKSEPLPPSRPLVQKWMLETLTDVADHPNQGNVTRGEAIFRDALCARCHRFGQRGPSVGPDLTSVAGRFSRHDILDSIINPSKAIAENYRAETIQTADGKVVTGRLMPGGDFRSEKVRLIPDLLRPDQIIELDKQSIEDHRQSELSPMPQGLLDSFTKEEISDLLAYLTGREPFHQ